MFFQKKLHQSEGRKQTNKQTNETVLDLGRPKTIRATESCQVRRGGIVDIAESGRGLAKSSWKVGGVVIHGVKAAAGRS